MGWRLTLAGYLKAEAPKCLEGPGSVQNPKWKIENSGAWRGGEEKRLSATAKNGSARD
jgi:hypothetical protein